MDFLFIQLLLTYQAPAIFLGSLFFGETVILSAAFLAGQGLWSLATVFWLALTGTIIADVIWFQFGKFLMPYMQRLWKNKAKHQDKYQTIVSKLESITGHKPFLALLFIKFLYGTRILTIFYLSAHQIKLSTFILFDIIGTIFWLAVMLALGWLAGQGLADYILIVNGTKFVLLFLVLVVLFFKLASLWLEKKIIKK